ncbi:MAG: PIN domain-containing protein [Acidobacteria bacterium]|nr:PIN domain-containing protein [Acidobacteriota bacterium]
MSPRRRTNLTWLPLWVDSRKTGGLETTLDLAEGLRFKPSRPLPRLGESGALLSPGADVAGEYGCLKHRLKGKGRPLPENDIWIAAAARHHELILVTRDGHFREVEELQIAAWANRR